jgi:hypothetical protein
VLLIILIMVVAFALAKTNENPDRETDWKHGKTPRSGRGL